MDKETAIKLAESEFWKDMSKRDIAEFQLSTELLCMPFDIFHEAVEATIGRPVWTHEFGSGGRLREELYGGRPAPTIEEIINLIPEEKRMIITTT